MHTPDRGLQAMVVVESVRSDSRLVIAPARGGPTLVIEDAVGFALEVLDPTADGARQRIATFDHRAGTAPNDEIVLGDIECMNRAMATRASHDVWLKRGEAARVKIENLRRDWSMVDTPEGEWHQHGVTERICDAIHAMGARWPRVAVATKLLYLKRPLLVPILDSYVIAQLGDVRSLPEAIDRMRALCLANAPALHAIEACLPPDRRRTPLRILESCIWAAHPRSTLTLRAGAWERAMRPASATVNA